MFCRPLGSCIIIGNYDALWFRFLFCVWTVSFLPSPLWNFLVYIFFLAPVVWNFMMMLFLDICPVSHYAGHYEEDTFNLEACVQLWDIIPLIISFIPLFLSSIWNYSQSNVGYSGMVSHFKRYFLWFFKNVFWISYLKFYYIFQPYLLSFVLRFFLIYIFLLLVALLFSFFSLSSMLLLFLTCNVLSYLCRYNYCFPSRAYSLPCIVLISPGLLFVLCFWLL